LAPVGIFDDGTKEEVFKDGDDLWKYVRNGYIPSNI
jgi:hypothetical protein